jgi:8-amino-7-oxononanoate synthase
MPIQRYLSQLQEIRSQGKLRQLQEVQGPQGRVLIHEGKSYLNFSSNNYLGLANDPRLTEALIEGARHWGVGSGAARLVTGSMSPFHRLERALAEFKGTQAAMLFNSGYHANVGALSCLAGKGDAIFSDALNHASIIDGIRLSKAEKIVYHHNDVEDLRVKLRTLRSRLTKEALLLIATESVFSMDGDLCPLKELADLANEFNAILYLDEAHATGVFGEKGSGLAEQIRNHPEISERLIQMGTLGKALGCFGAYIAASKACIDFLINRARTFIFTTALPPAVAEAALAALALVASEQERRTALWERVAQFKKEFSQKIPAIPLKAESPIIPIILGDAQRALDLSQWLKGQGFWVNAIRPPTVPEGTSRLRITLMATHTEADIRGLIAEIKTGLKEFVLS